MNERISTQFDMSSAPRIVPIEQKGNKIDQRILSFSPLYEDVCREIYLKFKPFPKDIWKKININFPDLDPLLSTVSKAEEFRQSGGDMASMTIVNQLRNVGQTPLAFFLMRDVVSAKLHDNCDVCGVYSMNALKSCDFGHDMIKDSLLNMGIFEGPNSQDAKQLTFVNISSNLLNNPYFNHQKMT